MNTTYKAASATSAGAGAFHESVREFSNFVQSERQANPALRAVVGTVFSIIGIGIGGALLFVLLNSAR